MADNTLFTHVIPTGLIINKENLDKSLARTYGTDFSKTVEDDKWIISTPKSTPEDLKKHLFNVGILYPEPAPRPREERVPELGFVIGET